MNDLDASRNNADAAADADADADQDGNEASAMVGSGDGPSDTGALPRHKWHPHTVKVCTRTVHIIRQSYDIYFFRHLFLVGVALRTVGTNIGTNRSEFFAS